MTSDHPALRLEKQRASLKRLESKRKRLDTLIKSRHRSIAALERSAAKAGPVPVPEPKTPYVRPKKAPDPVLDRLNEWGAKAANVLGVRAPKVRWAGTKGACKRAARAHIHTDNGYFRLVSDRFGQKKWKKIRRGDCCVNRAVHGQDGDEEARRLMAHEVTHLVRKHGYGNGHGAKFQAVFREVMDALGATQDQAAKAAGELLDEAMEEVSA